jgi:hypothetical protein
VFDISGLCAPVWQPTIPVESNVAEDAAWLREQNGTQEVLEEGERIMVELGVVRRAGAWR